LLGQVRQELLSAAVAMHRQGLNVGTAGNLSARLRDGFVITPTAIPYPDLAAADLVEVEWDGRPRGRRAPSSEWRMHLAIYQARDDAGAIVHAHSQFATSLACLRRTIPAFHYYIALAGGDDIRCAPYATYGSAELAAHAVEALRGRRACLLANHGMIAIGPSIGGALALALEVENLAAQYWRTIAVGEPALLDAAEMARVREKLERKS
jgi:L-fuculose-phosphate aldolase